MSIRKKVVWLPYDMDTAIGINNSGLLTFSYDLEDIDTQQGGEFIFNGQDSVMWTNLRDAFGDDIKAMYQNLRSQGKLSYVLVERMFEEHQAKWSEAIFNEDAFFKYIEPLTNPDEGKQPDASYLPMAQGSKAEQRKWWLYNRFRYMDSKWNAGDALTDYIMMRAYSVAPQVLTPYADIYLTTSWDGELTQVRAHRGQTYTLPCPKDSANDAVVAIYSASQLSSVGDLSGLKIKNGNFSMATRLQELKIGDSASTYSNTNLIDLQLGNNTLLRTIDVRNCPNLAITVDLSGCKNIENVYFDGTGIAGVVLPNGGVLTTLHLPDTVTNLTVQNQPNITDFVLNDASNLSTLRLENCGELMDDAKELVAEMEDGSRIRLIGINWEFPTSQQLSDLYDLLDTMRGLDESGGNMPKVQISGVINVEYFSGDMAAMQERYPNVRITADHTIAILTYKTYDGASTLYTETINDGGNGTKTNSQSRDSDAQYSYTPNGWATEVNGNTNPNALVNVVGDRTVYAAYTKTLRKYTVTFVKSSTDGGGTLQTISNVDYGTVITAASAYTGATPTTSQGSAEDYPFEGWEPASATVQGNTTFTAKFGSPVVVEEISDSWDTIIANIDNGTYSTKYKVGNYKPLDLGTEGTINMQIVAMDADELASGGYAPLTFIAMELLATKHNMNDTATTVGGWETSKMRAYLNDTIHPLIPSNVATRLQRVNKVSRSFVNSSFIDITSIDTVWIPSYAETNGRQSKSEESGVMYSKLFDDTRRAKGNSWWLRTVATAIRYNYVRANGESTPNFASDANKLDGVALGFCLGLEQET